MPALSLRCLVLAFVLPACAGAGQTRKKLGISGATCTASSDCAADLQCVRAVCADWTSARPLEAVEAATKELEAAEAAAGRECAELDARRAAETEELVRELEALKAEQARIKAMRDELERKFKALVDEIERLQAAEEPPSRAPGTSSKSAPGR